MALVYVFSKYHTGNNKIASDSQHDVQLFTEDSKRRHLTIQQQESRDGNKIINYSNKIETAFAIY